MNVVIINDNKPSQLYPSTLTHKGITQALEKYSARHFLARCGFSPTRRMATYCNSEEPPRFLPTGPSTKRYSPGLEVRLTRKSRSIRIKSVVIFSITLSLSLDRCAVDSAENVAPRRMRDFDVRDGFTLAGARWRS